MNVLGDTDVLDETILDHDLHCQGNSHPTGRYGHVPSEPASFLLIAPCGDRWLMCAGWVRDNANWAGVYCDPGCGSHHEWLSIKVIPV